MASSKGDPETAGQRFSHLLVPIRDLAKNWEIDIASDLEGYLEELENVPITFDGGATTMNFAEAALLIQGSASIYSKKVEYLYALVYKTLDLLANNKKMQQAASVDDQGHDKDTTFDHGKNKEDEFLPLDDIKTSDNIDLVENDEKTIAVATIPRTPIALIPLDEVGKKDSQLFSRTGELLGSRMDFRMNTGTFHSSGALLLSMSNLSFFDQALHRSGNVTTAPSTQAESVTISEDARHGAPAPPSGAENAPSFVDIDLPIDPPQPVPDIERDETIMRSPLPSPSGVRTRRQQQALPPERVLHDVWKPEDPHEPKGKLKLFRRVRPFRIPSVLIAKNSSKKRSRDDVPLKQSTKPLLPLAEFCRLAFHSQAARFPSSYLKAPSFADFEDYFWAEQARRRKQMKRERELLLAIVKDEEERAYVDDANGADSDDELVMPIPPDTVPGATDVAPPADDSDEFAYEDGEGYAASMPTVEGDGILPIALEDPSNGLVVASYEDLVRKHVEGFIASANQYAHETDLVRRVQRWEEKIRPTLEEEDTHPPFDIHQYGATVLHSLPESDNRKSAQAHNFSELVHGQKRYNVCRLFLASLQLANNSNVDIFRDSGRSVEECVNSMYLRLLKREQINATLATYQAPSLQSKK